MTRKYPFEYNINNIVVRVQCQGNICIKDALKKLSHGVYNPRTFSALITKFRDPYGTVNIFSSGVLSIMGCRSVDGAMKIISCVQRVLGLNILSIDITNMLVTVDVGKTLDIQNIFERNRSLCVYDSKLFPSCNMRKNNSSIASSIFTSGKLTVYGFSSISEIEDGIDFILERVLDQSSSS